MSDKALQGKRIVLCVTGSIAAYKAVSLLRTLVEDGAEVSVVMTPSATQFVAPLTFEVLSGRRDPNPGGAGHGELSGQMCAGFGG